MATTHLKTLWSVKFAVSIFAFLSFQSASVAASFDCSKARSFAEKTICSSKRLSDLDIRLAVVYKEGLSVIGSTVRQEQRAWLKTIRDCKDESCLIEKYEQRIDDLHDFIREYNRQRRLEKGEL